jgi:hypothetical protein
MAKCLAPGCWGKCGPLSDPSLKVKTAEGLSRNDLCVLRLLFFHPLVLIPGGSKGKEEPIFKKLILFLSLPRKSSAISAYSAVHFSSSSEGAETFTIS